MGLSLFSLRCSAGCGVLGMVRILARNMESGAGRRWVPAAEFVSTFVLCFMVPTACLTRLPPHSSDQIVWLR